MDQRCATSTAAATAAPPGADTGPADTPSSDLGLSSLQLARLTADLEDAMGIEVPLSDIYDHPDTAQLVDSQLVEYRALR